MACALPASACRKEGFCSCPFPAGESLHWLAVPAVCHRQFSVILDLANKFFWQCLLLDRYLQIHFQCELFLRSDLQLLKVFVNATQIQDAVKV